MQPGTAATIVAAKIVSPSAAVPPVLLRMNVCVCVPLCVLSVCGMLWFLAGAKFSLRQAVNPWSNSCSEVLPAPGQTLQQNPP